MIQKATPFCHDEAMAKPRAMSGVHAKAHHWRLMMP
jgi:hypothetical protein